MQEIELKFQVPVSRRSVMDAAVAGRSKLPRMRLQAAYFDTPDRLLAGARMALRIRHEGQRVVQTLKGLGDDGLTRAEHNVELPADHDPQALADPALHAGTAVGDRLLALLSQHDGSPLALQYRTDIRRRTRQLRTRLGKVELAFDEGAILAGDRRLRVCELEIELVQGSPLAVIATARQWVLRHGLWLDTRSKAERGDMLSRGDSMAVERKAGRLKLSKDMKADVALRCVLLSCLDQVAVNASQVASGEYADEHVHQLRIGLRRLRTALRLFDAEDVMPEVTEQAAVLFRRLGVARDRAALGEPLRAQLQEALAAAGLPLAAPALPLAEEMDPPDIVRFGPAQALLLGLFEWTQGEGQASQIDFRLVKKLKRLHKKVAADLSSFDTLDDSARHRLRKRAKRLRYGVEFASAMLDKREVRRYLDALKDLQDKLGAFVDTAVAMQAYQTQDSDDPQILFTLGWLAARKKALVAEMGPVAKAFRKAPAFWRS